MAPQTHAPGRDTLRVFLTGLLLGIALMLIVGAAAGVIG